LNPLSHKHRENHQDCDGIRFGKFLAPCHFALLADSAFLFSEVLAAGLGQVLSMHQIANSNSIEAHRMKMKINSPTTTKIYVNSFNTLKNSLGNSQIERA